MKAVLPNSRISMAPITFEVENGFQIPFKNAKKPPLIPRKSPRESLSDDEPPSSIMTKVSKFEYLAAQNFKTSISPKVFSANLVTVNTPAKDVLGKAPPDIQTFAKNLPQSALNYSELNHNDKQNIKIPDRQIFGRKSSNYVNVTLNDTRTINNRVVIYENGCTPKTNDLNNAGMKALNVNRSATSSPSSTLGRNVSPQKLITNNTCNGKIDGDLSKCGVGFFDSLENLAQRKNEAELRRNKVRKF